MTARAISVYTVEGQEAFDVHWKTENTSGIVVVTLEAPVEDPRTVAELAGLRYLLMDKEVCGQDRTGNNLAIEVSLGAIKKVLQRRSTKKHLIPWTNFLSTRFIGAKLSTGKRGSWKGNPEKTDRISVARPSVEALDVPGIGPLVLTEHAIRRFTERQEIGRPDRAWRRLRQKLLKTPLRPAKIPAAVRARKVAKHGGTAEFYDFIDDSWQLVVTEEGGLRYLVTLYQRELPGARL